MLDQWFAQIFLLTSMHPRKKCGTTFLVFLTCTFGASLLGLFGQENGLNVGKDTSLGNGDSCQKLVQFFIISDCKLQVSRNDTSLLVVTSSIASQFQNFSRQVFHDSS